MDHTPDRAETRAELLPEEQAAMLSANAKNVAAPSRPPIVN